MANPSKRKGTAWEVAVCDYLRTTFPAVERRALCGAQDRGDVAGVPGWVVECKATKSIDLAGAVDEAQREAANAGVKGAVAVIKRRNKGVADAYAVMPLWLWAVVAERMNW